MEKAKKWENSTESLMCNNPYFADTIFRKAFRRRGIRPLKGFRELLGKGQLRPYPPSARHCLQRHRLCNNIKQFKDFYF
jgi:hypothetical protein